MSTPRGWMGVMGDTYYDEAARTAAVAKAEQWTDRQDQGTCSALPLRRA